MKRALEITFLGNTPHNLGLYIMPKRMDRNRFRNTGLFLSVLGNMLNISSGNRFSCNQAWKEEIPRFEQLPVLSQEIKIFLA